MTRFYLIRHGETDWNVSGRWQGHADQPLNARGRDQARRLAERLAADGVVFDAIYTSDLRRAFETAWQIGRVTNVPVQLYPPLREIDLGMWSGLMRHEVAERFPSEFALLEAGHDIPRGGAESRAMLQKRVSIAIETLALQHPEATLAIVTHGGPTRALLEYAGSPPNHALHIGNASITVLDYVAGNWTIHSVNDMQHLEDMGQAPDLMAPPDDTQMPEEREQA